MTKPFKGKLYNWHKVSCDKWGYDSPPFGATGYYYILGFTDEQLRKPGTIRATSRVIEINQNGAHLMCETQNSIYELVGEEDVGNNDRNRNDSLYSFYLYSNTENRKRFTK